MARRASRSRSRSASRSRSSRSTYRAPSRRRSTGRSRRSGGSGRTVRIVIENGGPRPGEAATVPAALIGPNGFMTKAAVPKKAKF